MFCPHCENEFTEADVTKYEEKILATKRVEEQNKRVLSKVRRLGKGFDISGWTFLVITFVMCIVAVYTHNVSHRLLTLAMSMIVVGIFFIFLSSILFQAERWFITSKLRHGV